MRTNLTFRGVPVAAGNHEVVFEFMPRPFYTGLWITCGAAAVLLSAGKSPASVATLLSNYAEPAVWSGSPGSGIPESPLREGAGLIKVDRSTNATVSASPEADATGTSRRETLSRQRVGPLLHSFLHPTVLVTARLSR